jgi:bla regulator protein blaR1
VQFPVLKEPIFAEIGLTGVMRENARIVRSVFVLVLVAACCGSGAWAQTPSAASHPNPAGLDYDVAAIKINNTGSGSTHIDISGGILQMTNVPLGGMLENAFDIHGDQILGLPHWAQVDRYDIAAKVVDMDPHQWISGDQQRVMLQHLLDRRFHLQAHIEKRTLPLLELVVAKGGIKFDEWKKPAEGEGSNKGSMNSINYELTAVGVPMDRLARFLERQTHIPVADKTGLNGIYNFHLKWQREEEGPASGLHDQALPTIYAALPEQLGLKLESGKGSVDVLVVDHIEQPSEN